MDQSGGWPLMRSPAIWIVAISLIACVAHAGDADLPVRVIEANYGDVKGPLDRRFQFCIGSDRAAIHLRPEHFRDLKFVREQCGFLYARFHGLLTDEMGVYKQTASGEAVYDWTKIDRVYDQLLSIGMKPFVELTFMPRAMASGQKTIFWWKGNITPPASYDKWDDLIHALVQHLTSRYGAAEVKTWFFEVWNEPNLNIFWSGTQADYFHLYEGTVRAIKSVDPDYRVGGPASAGGAWIPEFIWFCHDNNVPVDFVASHTYGVIEGFADVDGRKRLLLDPNPDAIVGDVAGMAHRIATSPLPNLPLYVTEWSASYSPRDPVHDSYFSAPYILDKIKRSGSTAACMSYWTFSDQFEENGPPPSPFHGGFGLLNDQGLPKPAFFAYRFLNQLGNSELNCDDPQTWVCRDDRGVQILFWNYTLLHQDTPNQVFFARDLPAQPAGVAKIKIDGLPPGNYTVSVTRVGYRHNDVYTAYLQMGKPRRADARALIPADDLAKLRAECLGLPSLVRSVSVMAGQPAVLELELSENDVCFVSISR